MVKKPYEWVDGVDLEDHSKSKHRILRKYLSDYLVVRCTVAQRERFRLAIVDGFAGGGRYKGGAPGSPLIFIEELKCATGVANTLRAERGLQPVEIECLLVFNDVSIEAIDLLKTTHVPPLLDDVAHTCPKLHLRVEYLHGPFEISYPTIKNLLTNGRYRSNVLFNLDQSGDIHVQQNTIIDIMRTYPSAEIFYTIMISSLLAFLQKNQPEQLRKRLDHLGLADSELHTLSNGLMATNEWLGAAERLVFEAFYKSAPFASPFSIRNPNGWHYWLIHFANSYRARQVYNNVLHENATLQAHFGRSGLDMLQYDPRHENGTLFLFDEDARASSRNELSADIPRFVEESGNAIPVRSFYERVYNATPAHTDDIHTSIIDHPDLEVITPAGGKRRKANTIGVNDVINLKKQRSIFPLFFDTEKWKKE